MRAQEIHTGGWKQQPTGGLTCDVYVPAGNVATSMKETQQKHRGNVDIFYYITKLYIPTDRSYRVLSKLCTALQRWA